MRADKLKRKALRREPKGKRPWDRARRISLATVLEHCGWWSEGLTGDGAWYEDRSRKLHRRLHGEN